MSTEPDDEPADDRDGYVHDPGAMRGAAGDGLRTTDVGTSTGGKGMGRRGWVLLAAVLLALFGAPAVIYLRPPGVPFEVALLVVPLVPAFLLGVAAVWAMTGRNDR